MLFTENAANSSLPTATDAISAQAKAMWMAA